MFNLRCRWKCGGGIGKFSLQAGISHQQIDVIEPDNEIEVSYKLYFVNEAIQV